MLNVVVMVSGGGTNLQAIIDAVEAGTITNTRLAGVISNNKMHMPWSVPHNTAFPRHVFHRRILRTGVSSIKSFWRRWTALSRIWWCWQVSW